MNPGSAFTLPRSSLLPLLRAGVLVGALIFLACLLSIMTRLWTGLAYVWVANALLLGLMIRFPSLSNVGGWVGAGLAYLLADLLTGAGFEWALKINASNFIGVVAGYLLLKRLPETVRKLEQPASIPWVCGVAALAALVSSVYSGVFPSSPTAPGFWKTAGTWFSFEFASYLLVLPLILTLPAVQVRRPRDWFWRLRAKQVNKLLPGLALLLSLYMMSQVGGPVAVAYPVSALLWCAISYPKFLTVLLTTACSFVTLLLIWQGILPGLVEDERTLQIAVSVRVGVALITLGPIMVATVMAARGRLLLRLKHLAEHDYLTGLLNRHAFTEQAQRQLQSRSQSGRSHAAMMLDIDHFKRINDNYGHQAGDTLLSSFAQVLKTRLRKQDVLGRFGGEEFAVFLPDCSLEQAQSIAERIRSQIEQEEWVLGVGKTVPITVSIGVIAADAGASLSLHTLLGHADEALYEAKAQGRNRIHARLC